MLRSQQPLPRRSVTFYNVDEGLWARSLKFLNEHKRIPSLSALMRVSLDTYLELGEKYGIDADWKIKLPLENEGGKE